MVRGETSEERVALLAAEGVAQRVAEHLRDVVTQAVEGLLPRLLEAMQQVPSDAAAKPSRAVSSGAADDAQSSRRPSPWMHPARARLHEGAQPMALEQLSATESSVSSPGNPSVQTFAAPAAPAVLQDSEGERRASFRAITPRIQSHSAAASTKDSLPFFCGSDAHSTSGRGGRMRSTPGRETNNIRKLEVEVADSILGGLRTSLRSRRADLEDADSMGTSRSCGSGLVAGRASRLLRRAQQLTAMHDQNAESSYEGREAGERREMPPPLTPILPSEDPTSHADAEPTASGDSGASPMSAINHPGQVAENSLKQLNSTESMRSDFPSGRRKSMTAREVLNVRIQEITAEIGMGGPTPDDFSDMSHGEASGELSVPPVFKLCGVVAWDRISHPRLSAVYQWVVVAISVLALAAIIVEVATDRETLLSFKTGGVIRLGHLSNVPLAAGAVSSLVLLLGVQGRQHTYEDTYRLLKSYSDMKGFREMWELCARKDKALILGAWIATVFLSCLRLIIQDPMHTNGVGIVQVVHVVAMALLSGVLLWMTYCVLYLCRGLVVMIDEFSCECVSSEDLAEIANTWNVLQAILRKASATIELGFLALVALVIFTVPAMVLDVATLGMESFAALSLGPCIVSMCSVLWMFTMAALITDKCSRVPALINSLNFGPGTERSRQHTIEYISSSAAGFYICDARLTATMVFKFMYGWAVVALSLSTRFVTDD